MILPNDIYEKISKRFDELFEEYLGNPLAYCTPGKGQYTEENRVAFRVAWQAYLDTQELSEDDWLETLENKMDNMVDNING